MKKFLSFVLAFLMLAVMLPVTAMADDIPVLGSDKVWQNVTPANVQDVLDGKYGSIDNTTIILSAGTYGQLELGRATKYEGSNTQYMVGGFDESAANYRKFDTAEALKTYKNQTSWTPSPFYIRSMSNVTLKAADGATVTIGKMSAAAGQIYGTNAGSKYDYVLDIKVEDTNKSYYVSLEWNNITFVGLNFTSAVNIESSETRTSVNGLHFESCSFNSDYPTTTSAKAEGMGIRFVSWTTTTTDNLKNLTVNNCKFESCYEGVYTNPVYGVSVTNSTFNNINHNAIAIQDTGVAVDHGSVVITGNTFTNVSDRIIRFNEVGEDTTITISKNTSINSGDDSGEIIKATTRPDTVNVSMTGNSWGTNKEGTEAKFGNGFTNVVNEPINENPTVISIDRPTEDTPKTDDQKNPATGANDVVAAAVALMAVSALGMAVLTRKK